MRVKVKEIRRGDVVEDREVVAVPTRVAEVEHLKDVVMIRYACRRGFYAYDAERELAMVTRPSGL